MLIGVGKITCFIFIAGMLYSTYISSSALHIACVFFKLILLLTSCNSGSFTIHILNVEWYRCSPKALEYLNVSNNCSVDANHHKCFCVNWPKRHCGSLWLFCSSHCCSDYLFIVKYLFYFLTRSFTSTSNKMPLDKYLIFALPLFVFFNTTEFYRRSW